MFNRPNRISPCNRMLPPLTLKGLHFAGFVCQVWEISCYCLKTCEQKTTSVLTKKLQPGNRRNSHRGRTIDTKPPPLLVSFRAHLKPIISLDFVDSRQLIISASTDASVRLWTQSGKYIGNKHCSLLTMGKLKRKPLYRCSLQFYHSKGKSCIMVKQENVVLIVVTKS